jgi:hypothetical protein
MPAGPAPTQPPGPTEIAPVAPPGLTPPASASPAPDSSEPVTGTVPAVENDNLVKLIDAFVLYSFYFLLGLGLIIFLTVAIFFYYLHRRSQALRQQQEPPENPEL